MDVSNSTEKEGCDSSSFMPVRERLQCAICFLYLREPVLTICGHRFCEKCLSKWVNERDRRCPIDNNPLEPTDIFPDNYTKREIAGLSIVCPNDGCFVSLSVTEFEDHYEYCKFLKQDSEEKVHNCPYASVGCDYKSSTPVDLATHQSDKNIQHTKLLLDKISMIRQNSEFTHTDEYMDFLKGKVPFYLNDVYEKLTELDQRTKEYAIELKNVTSQLNECLTEINYARSEMINGRLLWKIQKVDEMIDQLMDPGYNFFSPMFRTSEMGYRFQMRVKLSRGTQTLAVYIYLAKGHHDFMLKWPFVGEITVSIIHPINPNLHLKSVIKSNGSEAFQRPVLNINTKGFGFNKTATLTELTEGGYLHDNQLIILGSIKSEVDL